MCFRLANRTRFTSVHSEKSQTYEPLLLENERDAVAELLQFLESKYFASHFP